MRPDVNENYALEQRSPPHAERATAFEEFLRGKSVVLVCPSKALESKSLGQFIDSHGVVVHVNQGWAYNIDQERDFGSRADVVYHYLSLPNEFRRDYDLEAMKKRGVRFLAIPPRPEGGHLEEFFYRNRTAQLPFVLFDEPIRSFVRREVPGLPFAGVWALVHLLRTPLRSLHVLGMNFFSTGHFEGYDGRTEAEQIAYAHESQFDARGTSKQHFIAPQQDLVRRLLVNDARFSCDDALQSLLKVPARRALPLLDRCGDHRE